MMIKSISLAAVAVLVFVGCNSGGSDSSSIRTASANLSTFSEAEKLAYAIANKDNIMESADNRKSSRSKQSRDTLPCESGTMEILFPVPLNMITEDTVPNEIVYHNCEIGGETASGGMKMSFDEYGKVSRISFPLGFSTTGGDFDGSVKAGGYMDMTTEGEWEVATINMEMTMNGVIHGGENLVYKSKELSDGSSIEFPVSGKEKIGESSYFTVDPAYDASATPFKSDANDDLVSGLFKYVDGQDHAVELEITGKNIVTVRVDEDGNGSFVGDEVSSINLD